MKPVKIKYIGICITLRILLTYFLLNDCQVILLFFGIFLVLSAGEKLTDNHSDVDQFLYGDEDNIGDFLFYRKLTCAKFYF